MLRCYDRLKFTITVLKIMEKILVLFIYAANLRPSASLEKWKVIMRRIGTKNSRVAFQVQVEFKVLFFY